MAGQSKVAKLTIRITHVSWRDGRPRFQPSPALRRDGWTGEDLRHGPADARGNKTGPWYTPEECLAFMKVRETEIINRRAEIIKAKTTKKKVPEPPARRTSIAITVADLFESYFRDNPKMKGVEVVEGKRRQKAASANTITFYRQKSATIESFDPMIWVAPVDALTGPIVRDLYERLWSAKGLATAVAVVRTLSAAISWGMLRGKVKLAVNPCKELKLETPDARIHAFTPVEIRHLIAAADAIGLPEIGDAILFGVWTGQRQNDRLAMIDAGLVEGRRVFRQAKTKAIVAIREVPELAVRLATAKARRKDWPVQPMEAIVEEAYRRPWERTNYSKAFARVRDAAANGVEDKLKPMPSIADGRDQDLRDTAVTWLARAGATLPEICAITGHSLQAATQVLKHYLASHPDLADNAIKKMLEWIEGQG